MIIMSNGWDTENLTWEPADHVDHCPEVLEKYFQSRPQLMEAHKHERRAGRKIGPGRLLQVMPAPSELPPVLPPRPNAQTDFVLQTIPLSSLPSNLVLPPVPVSVPTFSHTRTREVHPPQRFVPG